MARENMKKVTSRRGELYGIRERKGSKKYNVELRLPRQGKFWKVVGDVEDAKRLVKLVCGYIDEDKAFPPDHPDLHSLQAFCKKEFQAFVWEEFQRNDATELLEDPSHGVDDKKTEEEMMPTNAPESGSDSGVETCAGGAQLTTPALIRDLECVERLEHELTFALENVERLGILLAEAQAAQKAAARSAREEYPTMLQNGGVAPPPAPTPFAAGPSDTRGFAPTLENGVLGSPSPALTAFEAGLSDTRGFGHMVEFDELDAHPTLVLLEASALYAGGSIASPEHDDWSGEFFNFDEYYADAS